MCSRFALTATTKDIEKLMAFKVFSEEYTPSDNIAPGAKIYAIVDNAPDHLSTLQWGLIPSWSKDISIGNKMFNARAETVWEKVSFRHLINKKRCLIPASSYFEWKQIDGKEKKQKYRIGIIDQPIFFFAGLWDEWKNPATQSIVKSATIITCEPNEEMSKIHNRMPVIINSTMLDAWLAPNLERSNIETLLMPYLEKKMYFAVEN